MAFRDGDLERDLGIASATTEDGKDKLVFPLNVHESLAASGSLRKGEKTGIVVSFWLLACGLLAWFLAGWLRQVIPGYYGWIVLGIEVALQLTVGVFILRWVLDERTMMSEMDGANNSFAKFFGIYHEIVSQEGSTYPFDVIEFADGSYGVYIQFLLGYNTNQASAATYEVNRVVQSMINKSGMAHKVLYTNEKFANSSAADELRKVVAGVEDPRLFKAYRDIVQGILKTASEESNVLCATYVIYAKTRIQKEELTQLVINILNTVGAEDTAYREVSTLSYDDIVEFYRNYYKLDVLDMGLIRVHAVKRKSISCSLRLLRVYGESGKVYNTQDMKRLRSEILREHGLEQVN